MYCFTSAPAFVDIGIVAVWESMIAKDRSPEMDNVESVTGDLLIIFLPHDFLTAEISVIAYVCSCAFL